MLSPQALKDFKEIWLQEYGEEISEDFAVVQALNLLTLFNSIYKPIKKIDYERKEK